MHRALVSLRELRSSATGGGLKAASPYRCLRLPVFSTRSHSASIMSAPASSAVREHPVELSTDAPIDPVGARLAAAESLLFTHLLEFTAAVAQLSAGNALVDVRPTPRDGSAASSFHEEVAIAATRLAALYTEVHRAYHSIDHISDCLLQLQRVRSQCRQPDVVGLALLYHDAIYEPRGKANEARSAALAADTLYRVFAATGMPPSECHSVVKRITDLIMLTCHGTTVCEDGDVDGQLLIDIDLSILGRERGVYERYDRGIRFEYAHVPEQAYREGRRQVLQSFLMQPRIFHTEPFAAFEAPARANLHWSCTRLADPTVPLDE